MCHYGHVVAWNSWSLRGVVEAVIHDSRHSLVLEIVVIEERWPLTWHVEVCLKRWNFEIVKIYRIWANPITSLQNLKSYIF